MFRCIQTEEYCAYLCVLQWQYTTIRRYFHKNKRQYVQVSVRIAMRMIVQNGAYLWVFSYQYTSNTGPYAHQYHDNTQRVLTRILAILPCASIYPDLILQPCRLIITIVSWRIYTVCWQISEWCIPWSDCEHVHDCLGMHVDCSLWDDWKVICNTICTTYMYFGKTYIILTRNVAHRTSNAMNRSSFSGEKKDMQV